MAKSKKIVPEFILDNPDDSFMFLMPLKLKPDLEVDLGDSYFTDHFPARMADAPSVWAAKGATLCGYDRDLLAGHLQIAGAPRPLPPPGNALRRVFTLTHFASESRLL